MAPPATFPRLTQLRADEVADEVYDKVNLHVQWLAKELSSQVTSGSRSESSLWKRARRLARYAKLGERTSSSALKLLGQVGTALYQCAGAQTGYEVETDRFTKFGVVHLASMARVQLAEGEPISARELAALASLNERRIRQLVDEGLLQSDGRRVSARSAIRLLKTRGVPGFTPAGSP